MSIKQDITFVPFGTEVEYEVFLSGQSIGIINPDDSNGWISPSNLQKAVGRAVMIAAKEKFGRPIELEFED